MACCNAGTGPERSEACHYTQCYLSSECWCRPALEAGLAEVVEAAAEEPAAKEEQEPEVLAVGDPESWVVRSSYRAEVVRSGEAGLRVASGTSVGSSSACRAVPASCWDS